MEPKIVILFTLLITICGARTIDNGYHSEEDIEGILDKIKAVVQKMEQLLQSADNKINTVWQKIEAEAAKISKFLPPKKVKCVSNLVNKGKKIVVGINNDVKSALNEAAGYLTQAQACGKSKMCLAKVLVKATAKETVITVSLIPKITHGIIYVEGLGPQIMKCAAKYPISETDDSELARIIDTDYHSEEDIEGILDKIKAVVQKMEQLLQSADNKINTVWQKIEAEAAKISKFLPPKKVKCVSNLVNKGKKIVVGINNDVKSALNEAAGYLTQAQACGKSKMCLAKVLVKATAKETVITVSLIPKITHGIIYVEGLGPQIMKCAAKYPISETDDSELARIIDTDYHSEEDIEGILDKIKAVVQKMEQLLQSADNKINTVWQKIEAEAAKISKFLPPKKVKCVSNLVNKGKKIVVGINNDVKSALNEAAGYLTQAQACGKSKMCLAKVLVKATAKETVITVSLIPKITHGIIYVEGLGPQIMKCAAKYPISETDDSELARIIDTDYHSEEDIEGILDKIKAVVQKMEQLLQSADNKINTVWQKIEAEAAKISKFLPPKKVKCVSNLVNKGKKIVVGINNDVKSALNEAAGYLTQAQACGKSKMCLAKVLVKATAKETVITVSLIPKITHGIIYVEGLGPQIMKCAAKYTISE